MQVSRTKERGRKDGRVESSSTDTAGSSCAAEADAPGTRGLAADAQGTAIHSTVESNREVQNTVRAKDFGAVPPPGPLSKE